jgi:phage terminase large subunit GpA-like protein
MVSTISVEQREKREQLEIERELTAAIIGVLRPPSELSLSEWADSFRILSSESSAEQGAWVTAKAPYEKDIMDAISDPLVPRVVVQKASQVGITDSAILNSVGYFADQDPCPILVVQPTIELAEAFSTDRLSPMIRDTPCLREKFAEPRARDSQNTLRRKSFFGGYVAMGGANSAASLSGRPVRVVLLDDVDHYPASAGTEGNPLQLAIARTSGFWNRKAVVISSPGIEGVSHIEREMATSTCEHWYLACPECGAYQLLMFERIDFDDLTHTCQQCAARSPKYRWISGHGEYRAHRPLDERGNKVLTRGFYVSGLYSPWVEWDVIVSEFVRAARASKEGDEELLKAWRNTRLGLLHKQSGQRVEVDLYKHRREVYQTEIPDGVLVLTSGGDVGDRELYYEIVGWGKGRESWAIEFGILDGDPREQDVWDLLDEAVFNRVLFTFDGKKMRVRRMAVDSGFASDYVYAYTKARGPRAISTKGVGGIGKPLIKGAGTITKGAVRARLQILGVDSGKEEVTNRLMVSTVGPGYCHFPKLPNDEPARGYDEEYFRGLTAESRITKAKWGYKTYIWTKRLSQRNEPFDCRILALAAVVMPASGIHLDTMSRDLLSVAEEEKTRSIFGAQQGQADIMADAPPVTSQHGQAQQKPMRFGAQNRPIW